MKICSIVDISKSSLITQKIPVMLSFGHKVNVIVRLREEWRLEDKSLIIQDAVPTFGSHVVSIFNPVLIQAVRTVKKFDCDLILGGFALYGEALLAGLICRKPVMLDITAPWSFQNRELITMPKIKTRFASLAKRFRYFCEQSLAGHATSIVCLSRGLKDWMMVTMPHLNQNNVHVVYPFVDPDNFKPSGNVDYLRRKYELNGNKVITYIGVFDQPRGIDVLIKSLRLVRQKIQKVKLLLVGPFYPYQSLFLQKLYDLVVKIGLKNEVIWTGWVPHDQLSDYMSITDIFTLPLRDNFTYRICPSIKLFEYMTTRKPIVATNVGTGEFIKDGYDALVVEPDNEHQLARSFVTLLEKETLAQKLGNNAYDTMMRRFHVRHQMCRYQEILEKTVNDFNKVSSKMSDN